MGSIFDKISASLIAGNALGIFTATKKLKFLYNFFIYYTKENIPGGKSPGGKPHGVTPGGIQPGGPWPGGGNPNGGNPNGGNPAGGCPKGMPGGGPIIVGGGPWPGGAKVTLFPVSFF